MSSQVEEEIATVTQQPTVYKFDLPRRQNVTNFVEKNLPEMQAIYAEVMNLQTKHNEFLNKIGVRQLLEEAQTALQKKLLSLKEQDIQYDKRQMKFVHKLIPLHSNSVHKQKVKAKHQKPSADVSDLFIKWLVDGLQQGKGHIKKKKKKKKKNDSAKSPDVSNPVVPGAVSDGSKPVVPMAPKAEFRPYLSSVY